ncbi:hypothetical protein TWF102_003850 [Orbilia oligospora]|uniref:Uncharacterized protein n=1 Tax=Orbilia oligospora TaxID=2813651 RepID=A0A7C8N255_ORBOL|nr:hypothetical protein TWF102_003850 [Orbilia oligospora]KAF3104609.1 hypothetical protein TWF706_004410 [Orbilia oligospora]
MSSSKLLLTLLVASFTAGQFQTPPQYIFGQLNSKCPDDARCAATRYPTVTEYYGEPVVVTTTNTIIDVTVHTSTLTHYVAVVEPKPMVNEPAVCESTIIKRVARPETVTVMYNHTTVSHEFTGVVTTETVTVPWTSTTTIACVRESNPLPQSILPKGITTDPIHQHLTSTPTLKINNINTSLII